MAPFSSAGDRGEGSAGRRGGWRGAGDHPGAVVEGEGAGAIEARLVDAGEEVDAVAVGAIRGAVLELGEDPGWGGVMVLVVLDGAVLHLDAEANEEVVEVVAVLLLLGLAEDDEPASAAHELLDRVELRVGEAGLAGVRGGLPLRV